MIDFSTITGVTLGSSEVTKIEDALGTILWQKIVYYNVSISAGANGTVTINGNPGPFSDSVASGTTLTIEGTGSTGYEFDEWSDGNTDNPRTITVTSDLTLTAAFDVIHQPNDEIWYETNNGQIADFSNAGFNATILSNTYTNGKGVVKFNADVTSSSGNNSTSRATNLTKISFPDSFTSVGQHTFDGCPLTELDLNKITTIGYEAFDFNHIQHLHIPATCTNFLRGNPFRSTYITQITVDPNNPTFTDGSAHNGGNCVYNGTTIAVACKNTVIPDNCTSFGEWSFSCIPALTTLDIPSTVTSLQGWAVDFDTTMVSNPSLSAVYARTTPTFGTNTFDRQKTGGTLYYTSGVNYSRWLSNLPSGWTAVLLCDVTISAGSNGSISVNGISGNYHQPEIPSGTQLTLVATPAANYQFDSWSDGDTNATRTITVTGDLTLTASYKIQPALEPFYIEDLSGSNNTLNIYGSANTPDIEVFASTDGTNWTSMGTTSSQITATVPANGKLYLKATANQWGTTVNDTIYHNRMNCLGNYAIGGNIMSLLSGDNYQNATLDTNYTHQLCGLFDEISTSYRTLIDASNLVLPANTTEYCYSYMFQNCLNLTAAPALPATTLAADCYRLMFVTCTSLTAAPALPATTLANRCYYQMFEGCTALTTAPATLPATNTASYCCYRMFAGCSALTTAPTLQATTLAANCYRQMFDGCSSLNSVTTYANTKDNLNPPLSNWLNGVSATGDFYNLGQLTYTADSASGIPSGWTEHTSL